MTEALAVAALLISAAALLLAWRAVSAAERAAATSPRAVSAPIAAPGAVAQPSTPSTDPSVLVRLDAIESRQASLDLLSSVGAAPGVASVDEGAGPAASPPASSTGRRAHPMFP